MGRGRNIEHRTPNIERRRKMKLEEEVVEEGDETGAEGGAEGVGQEVDPRDAAAVAAVGAVNGEA